MARIFHWLRLRILVIVCFSFVMAIAISEILRLPPGCPEGDICQLAGNKLRVEGKVVSLTSERLEKTIIEIEAQKNKSGKIQVIFPHTQYGFQYGDRIVLEGKLKLPSENPDDHFSYPVYLAGRGIFSVLYYPKLLNQIPKSPSASWQENLYETSLQFREKVRRVVNRYLNEPDSSILNAMVIGDQGSVPQEMRQKLSRVGIVHILSVSGAHITLLIVLIVFFVTKITGNRFLAFLFVLLGVVFYLLLAGSPNCASRSAIMGVMAFLALYQGKISHFGIMMWLSAAILLFLNPIAVLADIGFELSFLAILGMVYIYPALEKAVAWGKEGFYWKAVKILLLSISISLTTTPLVYYYFGNISWISPLANLVLLPLFSLVLPAGFLLIILGLLAEIAGAGILDKFGDLAALFIHYLLSLAEYLAGLFLKIPGSYSESVIQSGWVILYYIGLFFLTFIFRVIVKKYIFSRRLDYFGSSEFLESHVKVRRGFTRFTLSASLWDVWGIPQPFLILFYLLFLFAVLLLFLSSIYFYSSNRSPCLIMLNVGQGDAVLLDWPKYHFQMLIDGGPGRRILSELGNVLPFYDRKIELMVLTHPHQDHLEGLISVLGRYKVSQTILPTIPRKSASVPLENIFWKKLIENKIPISIAKRGQEIFLDSASANIAHFRLITPFFDYACHPVSNLNNQSAVFKMEYPRKILFTGDAQAELEKIIADKESHNLESEILKISHHGSRFSSTDKFLNAVKPEIALISVGKDNLFGHPARETIGKLNARNVKIYRTDEDGRAIINFTTNNQQPTTYN